MCKVKALVGTFKQENAPVGTITVIVKTDGSFAALVLSSPHSHRHTNTGRGGNTGVCSCWRAVRGLF